MFDKLKEAREEKCWVLADAAAPGAPALQRADAGAAALCRKKELQYPGAESDAVFTRNIARAPNPAQKALRLLACAPMLSCGAARRQSKAYLARVSEPAVTGRPDPVWVLGMLAYRRPEAFAAELGVQLARLPEAVAQDGRVLRAAVLEGVARGLNGMPDTEALKAALLARSEAFVADKYPALSQLLAHHTWNDPDLSGDMPQDAPGFHSLGLMRQFREACLHAVSVDGQSRLRLAEAMAHACNGFAGDLLFEAVSRVLAGKAQTWVQNWAELLDMRDERDWVSFVSWALSMYDQRAFGDPVAYFVCNLLSETAAAMRPLDAAAFAAVDASETPWLRETCERLKIIHESWRHVIPAEVGQWLPNVPRAGKIEALTRDAGAQCVPERHMVTGLVHSLMQPARDKDMAPRGAFEATLSGGGPVTVGAAGKRFVFRASDGCTRQTLSLLRDTLGDFLIDHHANRAQIKLALGLFAQVASADGRIDGRRVAAAARLMTRLPPSAAEQAEKLAQALQSGDLRAGRAAFMKVMPACDEMTIFHLLEWLCAGGHAQAMLADSDKASFWAERLRAHAAESARKPWAAAHLDAWQPDEVRLNVYANVLHRVVPGISAGEREKARNLMAFLMASEGPARAMAVTNWQGHNAKPAADATPVPFAPSSDVAYASMRAFCREANLKTPQVVNVIIGDACVVTHGEKVPDISRFVALASDEIGRAMVASWQNVPFEEARKKITALFDGILSGFACLDGWVTNLNEMMEKRTINLDGSSLEMVLDLQGKRDDNERCSEYLRVFRLQCAARYRVAKGLGKDTPLADFEEKGEYIRGYYNAGAFEAHLEREHFHAARSIPELVDYQVDAIGVLERV